MYSSFPSTPGRGRSRFSKVLPVPPGETPARSENPPAAIPSRSSRTDLPPLPSDAIKPSMAIPRRPVGGGAGGDVKNEKPARAASIASVSSVYSDSPRASRSLSGSSSTKDSLSGVDSPEDGETPSLPPKDKGRQTPDEKSQTHKLSSSSISSFDNALHPIELWRRRSLKSEHSFNGLVLAKSNGSTASPPRRQKPLPADRPPLSRSHTGRKPVPVRPAPPQPDYPPYMGNKVAKLRKKGSREDSSDEGPAPASQQYESIQRLPTPDYLKADKQQPVTPSILSPVSPFTPPDDKPPLVPRKSESRSLVASHGSSDVTVVARDIVAPHAPTPENDPPVNIAHSRDGSDTLTPQPISGKTSPLSLPSPVCHAAYFPTVRSPAPPGTILPCPELDLIHLECYQSHRIMKGSNNRVCPTACMVCQRQDTEKRWRCAWCCLSACASCMRALDSVPGKDLRLALERIGN